MQKYAVHVERLFSCLVGTGLYSEDVSFSVLDKRRGKSLTLNVKFIGVSKYSQKETKIVETPFSLIRYNDIGESLEFVIKNWFDLEIDYHEIINVLVESLANNTRFSELNFWNLTRVIEGFDRMNKNNDESENNDKNFYIEKLTLAVESLKEIKYPHEEIIEKIRDGLKYGYEPNLRDRLNRMMKNVNSEPIFSFIGPNNRKRASFVHDVVDIRNKFTHPDHRDDHYTLEQMVTLTIKLRLLLWYHFMSKIGIDNETIGHSMSNSNRLKFW